MAPPGVFGPLPQQQMQQQPLPPSGLGSMSAAFGGPNPMMAMQQTPTMQYILQELASLNQNQTPQFPDQKSARATKKKRKKLSEEDIIDRCSRIVAFWIERDNRMDEDLSLYRLDEEAQGDGEVIQKNTPYVVVEKAANMIATQTPTIQVIPPKEMQKDESQKVEDFLRWSWDKKNKRWRRSQIQGSFRHAMAHFLCLRGWAAARMWFDPEVDPATDNPIRAKLFDPRQVYPQFGDDNLLYVVHKYWTTYGELKDDWEEAEKEFDEQDDDVQVEVTEYYDDWYHSIQVAGTFVKKPTAHEYGFVPWVIVTGAGSPIRATSNDQNSWVSDVGVSIFHGIKSSYAALNRILSQMATQVANAANPPSLYYYDPTLNKTPQPLDYTAGTTNFLLYDRERVDPLQLNPNPIDSGPVIDSLIDDIQKGSLPSILWGITGGTEAGFGISMMTDAARDQLYAVVEAMQEMFESVNEYELILIRDFVEGDIGFWTRDTDGSVRSGVTLNAQDIEASGTETVVKYRDISPKDKAMMAQLAAMLTEKKLISMDTAREHYLGIDNPERENQKVLFDLVNMDEDIVKKGLVPLALYQADPELFNLYLMLKMAELQGAPQQGMPPELAGLMGGGQPGQGLPPEAQAPIAQPGANPMMQSIGSALGGLAAGGPPGIAGGGATPLGRTAGIPIG
jgi:hypothetical protein